MNIAGKIRSAIHQSLEELDIHHEGDITVEHPRELLHGDFSTNIAMVLAKKEGKNPRELAEAITEKISAPEIASVEIAGPGFINIQLSDDFLAEEVSNILEKGNFYGWNESWKNKTILVEHSSPNLFKPFHIGHMMNNTVGEAMTRLCRTSSADVTMISYPSDVSLGIGKAVWQLSEYGIEKIDEFETIEEKMQFLGRCYAEGTQYFQDHPEIEPRVREITQDIYEHRDTPAYEAYKAGRDLNLQYFIQMTARLGSAFDGFIFESEAGIVGKELVKKNTPNIYAESNEAIIFEPTENDLEENSSLHTRVFINKDGNPTYEAKDTGLLKLKFDRYNPDRSIFVTDSEQGPYFEVVGTAAGKINPDWQNKTIHKTHGRMQFKGVKMSSRLGNTPIVSDILDAINHEVYIQAEGKIKSEEQADIISIAAIKYAVLRTQAGKNINFDPETSLSFEGDSGPYLQYTYARSQSMLRKAHQQGIDVSVQRPENWKITDIERYLYRYSLVVQQAFADLAPHYVVTYITELAQLFNSWYGNTKIVDAEDTASPYKLALTDATAQVIKNALWILGIEAPEEM
mgnify:CR=1 FL=1|tara:strand:+ start:802 stop:2517 length:1716 start_codon:yes stop_codon:yes gene_type:complete